jgi:hypothetical protein
LCLSVRTLATVQATHQAFEVSGVNGVHQRRGGDQQNDGDSDGLVHVISYWWVNASRMVSRDARQAGYALAAADPMSISASQSGKAVADTE